MKQYSKDKRDYRKKNGLCRRCGIFVGTNIFCENCKMITNKNQITVRETKKRQLVEYMGGHCHDCKLETIVGSVYDFHHLNPEEKDINIAKLLNRKSVEEIKKYLDNCVLLCSNCHRIRHYYERVRKYEHTS
jgi:ribosomal 50S subunit-associated protein YjgA (DUF615 family)